MLATRSTGRLLVTRSASFHSRPLPPDLIKFSSAEGKRRFDESFHQGYLEAYFPLAEQYLTQDAPAFCGLSSLVMVLNALRVDPGVGRRPWRGVWRWFAEDGLALPPHRTLEDIAARGITVDEFQLLAAANGARSEMVRPGDGATAQTLRSAIEGTTSRRDADAFTVVSYSRQALGQTGDGHFSPIAAYHPPTDSALVLDVARFKYPPHWVGIEELWKALHPPDPVTRRPRAFFTVRPQAICPDCDDDDCPKRRPQADVGCSGHGAADPIVCGEPCSKCGQRCY